MFRFLRVTVSDITERAHLAMDGPSLDIRPLLFTLALSHLSGMIPKKARKVIEGKEPVHVPDVGREEGNEVIVDPGLVMSSFTSSSSLAKSLMLASSGTHCPSRKASLYIIVLITRSLWSLKLKERIAPLLAAEELSLLSGSD